MAIISMAVATSHAPGLTGWFDKASSDEQEIVRGAFDQVHQVVVESRTDVLLVIANDHVENARLSEYPDFNFGLSARHAGPDEWFKPWLRVADYDLAGAPETGRTLYAAVKNCGRKLRASTEPLRFDDNLSVPVAMAHLGQTQARLVPILQNCTVPPVPDERACFEFGQKLGEAIREQLPADLRVGLYGSGGLSHEPGGRRYLEIDEKFDRWWMDLLLDGDHERLLAEATFDRMEEAGSGGTAELLSWIVVMGAIGKRPCKSLGYVAVDQWRCGVGGVHWDVSETTAGTGLDCFDASSRLNDLVQDLKWDPQLRARFQEDESAVLSEYSLADDERSAVLERNFRKAFDLGLHPYLLSQLARLIYGTGEKAGTSEAATALIRSLWGTDYDRYMSERS